MGESKTTREGWETVFRSSTDYEADMVRDRLDSAGIPAAVFSQRDHVYNLNVGDLARVYVLVPAARVDDAEALLREQPFTDAELEAAAAESVEHSGEDDPGMEQLLDSGIERIRFSAPEEPPDEESA